MSEWQTTVSCMYEGYRLQQSGVAKLGSHALDEYLQDLLQRCGFKGGNRTIRDSFQKRSKAVSQASSLRRQHGKVRVDDVEEQVKTGPITLESGEELYVEDGSVMWRCNEPLFQPSLIGLQASESLPSIISATIDEVCTDRDGVRDWELAGQLYGNILLVGDMGAGAAERLQLELSQKKRKVTVTTSGRDAVWVGATKMGTLVSRMCITRETYEQEDPFVILSRIQ